MVVNRQFVRDGNAKYLDSRYLAYMSGSDDGWVSWHFLFLSIVTISADLLRLRVELLAFAHSINVAPDLT